MALLTAVLFAASCEDLPTHPDYEIPDAPFVDASSGGHPDFFWVPPTVEEAPDATSAFDANALDELRVDVYQVDPKTLEQTRVESFTSTSSHEPSRIRLNTADESYSTRWLPGPSQVSPGEFYRVVVFRGDEEMGSVAVQIVRNRFELRRVDTSMVLGLIRGTPLDLHFRVQGSAPSAGIVVINEVESNGDDTDWVELYNIGDGPIDLSRFGLKDNDDTRDFTIAAGTILEAGSFLVLDDTEFDYGLGGDDEVRLYAPDGVTIVASYGWAAHAPTTYGRCPDGDGDFLVTTVSTRGAPNLCLADVRINEIESSGGTPGDWVELYNFGSTPIDLSDYRFSDDDDTHLHIIPTGTTLAPGAFLVIDEADLGFGLGGNDSARLIRPDGVTVVDQYSWESHAATSYGRCPDGVGPFASTLASTRGSANECAAASDAVKINEVESNGDATDWVEFYNTGSESVDLSGYGFKDNDDTRTFTIADGTTLAPGAFLVIEDPEFDFGLGGGDAARLFAPDGVTVLDEYVWESHAATTWGRCPDGTGAFFTTSESTKGAANLCDPIVADVRINEVESSGGEPGDWVELYNFGSTPIDLSGYGFKDDNDSRTFTIAEGTLLAPGAFLVLDEAEFDFGLGGADQARLFAADGATLVDSHGWDAHASTTYGRCPDAIGPFATTLASTKGAANACPAPITTVVVNEVESSGGDPGDWVEFYNAGAELVDLSGYLFRDNDPSHALYALPPGTELAPGAFLVIDETQFGFGLGSGDAAQLFAPDGVTLVATHAWDSHAATSYGRCPDGSGDFFTTTTVTKGAANDCSVAVVINEVESSGGVPGDWVELFNPSPLPVDLSGYTFRDGSTDNSYLLPVGTTVPGTGYLVLDEADFGFGLGGGDSAQLFSPSGTLLDGYEWLEHAATTYGRCPDATGDFTTTAEATKGSVNICPGDIPVQPWPGSGTVAAVDAGSVFGGDMSGLAYQPSGSSAPGVLWGSRNGGPGAVFRLVWDGSNWTPDTADGWDAGKPALYTDGAGEADAEGITVVGSAIYLATERNNANSGVSRNSILRYDATAAGASLVATHEWNITADLPPNTANTGLEAIAFVPDAFLVSSGFIDASTGAAYNPADYGDHAGGLFFVGVEATGAIYAYALNHTDGSSDQIAEIASGFDGVMGLEFDTGSGTLWAACDDGCGGEVALFEIDTVAASPSLGQFVITAVHARPAGMDNLNNEGIALGAPTECVGGERPFYWADDGETGGNALRRGSVGC